jgi:hypothetical protein
MKVYKSRLASGTELFPRSYRTRTTGEYAQLFRHIQYRRTPDFRPIATLAMALVSNASPEGKQLLVVDRSCPIRTYREVILRTFIL